MPERHGRKLRNRAVFKYCRKNRDILQAMKDLGNRVPGRMPCLRQQCISDSDNQPMATGVSRGSSASPRAGGERANAKNRALEGPARWPVLLTENVAESRSAKGPVRQFRSDEYRYGKKQVGGQDGDHIVAHCHCYFFIVVIVLYGQETGVQRKRQRQKSQVYPC